MRTITDSDTFHSIYAAVHSAHRKAPSIWTDHECNRVLTAAMAGKWFSWMVVGITAAALQNYAELNFKHKSGIGLTRAHLKPRIQTVRQLLSTSVPLSDEEFLEFWIKNDKTVICAKGENKEKIPEYIEIENPNGLLFSCENKLAGWHHRKPEREYLSELFERIKQL